MAKDGVGTTTCIIMHVHVDVYKCMYMYMYINACKVCALSLCKHTRDYLLRERLFLYNEDSCCSPISQSAFLFPGRCSYSLYFNEIYTCIAGV